MQAGYSHRQMRQSDIGDIVRIQAQCYPPSMQEDETAILSRIRDAGSTCWVALDGNRLCAYLFAYRSVLGAVTPLGSPFEVKPGGDTLYLHDLAVAPERSGRGAGGFLTQVALDHARAQGLRFSALVAVQDAHRYWHRLGYARHEPLDAHALAALRSYPGSPGYMMRPLQPAPLPGSGG